MFGFFKKQPDSSIVSPVDGRSIDITEVNDIAFSSKSMGDGIAVVPESTIVGSPCTGKLSMVFPSGHAFGVVSDSGAEVLVHIGIDTVNLNGKGFKVLKAAGSKVKCGDPIVEYDPAIGNDYDMTTMVIVTNQVPVEKVNLHTGLRRGETVMTQRA